MPRRVRIEYPGATYHLMSRRNRREDIFHGDVDRQDVVKTIAEARNHDHGKKMKADTPMYRSDALFGWKERVIGGRVSEMALARKRTKRTTL